MGKKKHKKNKHGKQAEAAAPLAMPPAIAGIALAAMKQVDTPAFQKLVAGALGAAAQALTAKRQEAPTPTTPPKAATPPVPPEPAAAAMPAQDGQPTPAPAMATSPQVTQAMEHVASQAAKAIEGAAALASRAIGTASVALERWADEQSQRRQSGDASRPAPPHES